MKKTKIDILIPFDLHARGRCDNCRSNIHDVFTIAKALVKKSGHKYVSLRPFSAFSFNLLEDLRNMAVKSQTDEDFSFYASQTKLMLDKWVAFTRDILNMGGSSTSGLSKDDLQIGLADLISELREIFDQFISAHEKLFQMGAPFPTEEILRSFSKD